MDSNTTVTSTTAIVGAASESAPRADDRADRRRKRNLDEARDDDDEQAGDDGSTGRARKRSRSAEQVEESDTSMFEKPAATAPDEKNDANETAQVTAKNSSSTEAEARKEASVIDDHEPNSKDVVIKGSESAAAVSKDEEAAAPKLDKPDAIAVNGEGETKLSETATDDKTAAKIPASSGFANFSSKSPFASLSGSTSTDKKPAPSSFANSGFSSFTNASSSPFASFGSPKAATDSSNEKKSAEKETSAFGSGATKTFGSSFGGLGGNFSSGGGFGSGGTLKSFASGGSGSKGFGNKPVKPLGGKADPQDDDEDDGDDDGADEGSNEDDDDDANAQDERFYERDLATGEEGEETLFSSRAKLYHHVDKQWKERGVGTFKLNRKLGGETQPRFVMRADGSQKVILNSPVTKDVRVEDRQGGAVTSKGVTFMAFSEGGPVLCILQMRSVEVCQDLAAEVASITQAL